MLKYGYAINLIEQGMTYREVVDITGLSRSTIKKGGENGDTVLKTLHKCNHLLYNCFIMFGGYKTCLQQ